MCWTGGTCSAHRRFPVFEALDVRRVVADGIPGLRPDEVVAQCVDALKAFACLEDNTRQVYWLGYKGRGLVLTDLNQSRVA